MIVIDGTAGEGGGQILRTALSLSACTGQPFRMKNIRARRKKPGLLRQHLTCVKAAEAVCNGRAKGAALGATEITFVPGDIAAGDYDFQIGSAGATGLVFQTVLPILLQAEESSTVSFGGGTHNKAAPPFEFISQSFLPAIAESGARVMIELGAYGFYPAGGGHWQATIFPRETPAFVMLEDRGALQGIDIEARCANLSLAIAKREVAAAEKKLDGLPVTSQAVSCEANGPGNVMLITVRHDHHTEVFAGFGEYGVTAERVAKRAAGNVLAYLGHSGLAGEHLADQLLVPLATGAGGVFTTGPLSSHFSTNVETVRAFLDVAIDIEETAENTHRITVSGH